MILLVEESHLGGEQLYAQLLALIGLAGLEELGHRYIRGGVKAFT